MKVLFATSEAYPFFKSGGLGDVSFGLPNALRKMDIDIRVIMPKYKEIPEKYKKKLKKIAKFEVNVGWREQYCGIEYLELHGIPFYFIDNEYYFKRPGAYGYYDDAERFAFFSRAIVEAIKYIDFIPNVLHLNDWQTSMACVLLNADYRQYDEYKDIKTIYTIHNLRYQGRYGLDILKDLFNLSYDYYTKDKLEYYNTANFTKGAIVESDLVTTVSKTYADEIKYEFYGEGLDGILREKSYKLQGVLNGVDYHIFDPKTDDRLYHKYESRNLKNKAKNKMEFQKDMGLEVNKDIPILFFISRLVEQKGVDLIMHVFEEIMNLNLQFILIGTGDYYYEDFFRRMEEKYKDKFRGIIEFNNTLAHRIYASGDFCLMPSKFEPCGLTQLIALKYGSLPIVRETGGLKDTITPYNEYTKEGNGFSFSNYNAHDMLYKVKDAINLYNDKKEFKRMVKNAMDCDFSWKQSALEYKNVYESLF